MTIEEVMEQAAVRQAGLVEITGGEPLIQDETPELCRGLLGQGTTVLVETNGSCDISVLPQGCVRIMDVKCPASGMAERMLPGNLTQLTRRDEVKFVIANRDDFAWAVHFVRGHDLDGRCAVIFTPVFGVCHPCELAEWILESRAPVRMGLQLHKFIWPGAERGR